MKRSFKIFVSISVVIFFFSFFAFAKEAPIGLNGFTWKKLGELSPSTAQMIKVILVRGIYEGAWSVDKERAKHDFYERVKYSTLADALDVFYADYSNEKIPISYALKVIKMQMTGESKAVIIQEIKQLRYEWSRRPTAYLVEKG